ncbi:MAG: Nif3-like dinuclear metal center hexameric protein [Flavobacteriales bacterium]|nr:Nif3-like dinuclear metal center hexameric protein [Flavobacteriales bacterium]
MKIKDLTQYLEEYAPLHYQESYDNCGLQIGGFTQQVKKALVTLDCTEAVIDEAIKYKCDLVIAHHPLIFRGLKTITGANYVERTVLKAIKHKIAIYAIHTNLDHVVGGVNWKIAERLKLNNCRVLAPRANGMMKIFTFCPSAQTDQVRDAMFKAGGGSLGNYDECSFNSSGIGTFRPNANAAPFTGDRGERHKEEEVKIEMIFAAHLKSKMIATLLKAHPYEEVAFDVIALENTNREVGSGLVGELNEEIVPATFMKKLKSAMNCNTIRHTELLKGKIKTVAVCGGAGSFLLKDAIRANADIFITGDFKYHEFFDAEQKIVIADIGHYESEAFTKQLIYEIINKKFPKFALRLSEVNTNPVNYYS